MTRKKIALLLSGSGYSLQALLEAQTGSDFPARVSCVVSDNESAAGYINARNIGLISRYLDPEHFDNKDDWFRTLSNMLDLNSVDYILVTNYKGEIPADFINRYRGRIIGVDAHVQEDFEPHEMDERQKRIESLYPKAQTTGATIRFIEEPDHSGPIILKERVPVFEDDSYFSIQVRLRKLVRGMLPRAIYAICKGQAALH